MPRPTRDGADPSEAARKGRAPGALVPRALMLGVAAAGVAADQLTKQWVIGHLAPGIPVPFLGRFLQLYLIRNPGAAFSLGEGATWVFSGLAIVELAGLLVVGLPRVRHDGWAVALGLLAAGVAGNLVDRLWRPPTAFHGHVVDFLMLPHWPVFNVADSMISVAAVLVVVLSFFGTRGPGGRPYERSAVDTGDPDRSGDREAHA